MTQRDTTIRNKHRAQISRNKPDCHICGQPINYQADWLNPLSFTVDHIIPLHKGGTDTLDNKAAAHRYCNRDKSDAMAGVTYVTARAW